MANTSELDYSKSTLDKKHVEKKERLEKHLPVANETRVNKLALMTRGIELSEDDTRAAKESYYLARAQFVKHAIALNYSDAEICTALDISGRRLTDIKRKIFNEEKRVLRDMTQLEHFIEYKLKQMEVVKDLDVLIEKYRVQENISGLSAALKAKAETLKEIKNTAQEVGLLERKPEEVIIVGGEDVKELTDIDLYERAVSNQKKIAKLLHGRGMPRIGTPTNDIRAEDTIDVTPDIKEPTKAQKISKSIKDAQASTSRKVRKRFKVKRPVK